MKKCQLPGGLCLEGDLVHQAGELKPVVAGTGHLNIGPHGRSLQVWVRWVTFAGVSRQRPATLVDQPDAGVDPRLDVVITEPIWSNREMDACGERGSNGSLHYSSTETCSHQ
jgi:hypothetical protein